MKLNDKRFKDPVNDFRPLVAIGDTVSVEFDGEWTSKGFCRSFKNLTITRNVNCECFFAKDKDGKETLIYFGQHRGDDGMFNLVPQTGKSKSSNIAIMKMINDAS